MLFILVIILVIIIVGLLITYNKSSKVCLSEKLDITKKLGHTSTIGLVTTTKINIPQTINRLLYNIELARKNLGTKVSIRLEQLGNDSCTRFYNIQMLVDKAYRNNVFIWLSCGHKHMVKEELDTYMILINKYDNLGITLACYRKNIDFYIQKVLSIKGKIRLVKGFYRDGELSWEDTSQKYLENSIRLLNSGYSGHELSGHDFKILKKIINHPNIYLITFGFYFWNRKYAFEQIEKYDFPENLNISLYFSYGDLLNNLKVVILEANKHNTYKLWINYIGYNIGLIQ